MNNQSKICEKYCEGNGEECQNEDGELKCGKKHGSICTHHIKAHNPKKATIACPKGTECTHAHTSKNVCFWHQFEKGCNKPSCERLHPEDMKGKAKGCTRPKKPKSEKIQLHDLSGVHESMKGTDYKTLYKICREYCEGNGYKVPSKLEYITSMPNYQQFMTWWYNKYGLSGGALPSVQAFIDSTTFDSQKQTELNMEHMAYMYQQSMIETPVDEIPMVNAVVETTSVETLVPVARL